RRLRRLALRAGRALSALPRLCGAQAPAARMVVELPLRDEGSTAAFGGGLPYRDVLSLKSEAQGLLPFGRSPTQCLPRYEGERHDADLLHIAVGSWPRLRGWSGVGTGLADQTDPSDCRLFRRGHRRRYGACGLRSALDPTPSAGGR